MTPGSCVFISAVSSELAATRELVAKTLISVGYEPRWQDVMGREQGDLRDMLRRWIDGCEGVIQLVGHCYGAEPSTIDAGTGRVSYTQYEAIYAARRRKPIWYFVDSSPSPTDGESEEKRELQARYRQRLRSNPDIYHVVDFNDANAIKVAILEIRGELSRLRRSYRRWMAVLTVAVLLTCGLVTWGLFRPPRQPLMTPQRAEADFNARKYAEAFDDYVQLSDGAPATIDYHQRIEKCARSGHLEKAFYDRYASLARAQPANAIFHNYLGNASLLIDPKDAEGKALGEYQRAAGLDSSFAPPLNNLGIIASRAGRVEEAESYFKRYLALEPQDQAGWVNLGILYVAEVEQPGAVGAIAANAEQALKRALAIDAASASAYKALGRLWSAVGRKEDALDAYERSYALDDQQPDVWQNIANAAVSGDDYKTRAEQAAPGPGPVRQLIDQENLSEAETACRKWLKAEPENALAWRLLGQVLGKLRRDGEYRDAVATAIRLASAPARPAARK